MTYRTFVYLSLGAMGVWLGVGEGRGFAQTASVFTTVATGNSSGIIIVSQNTGAITYCTSLVNVVGSTATPSDSCLLLGRATPSSGSASSLSVAASASSVFVVNNITGQILQCAAVDNVVGTTGRPEGSCVSLGAANR